LRAPFAGHLWRVTELPEDTQVLSAEEVAAITGEAEEEDETGAPERVAEPDEEHPLESPDSIRQLPDESGEEESSPQLATRVERND
jgi:hypothetical protein